MTAKIPVTSETRWGNFIEFTPIDRHVKFVVSTCRGQFKMIERENTTIIEPDVPLTI
jgi:hypothetical protein